MKVAVFSDVQGNLPAMQTAVEHIQAWRPDLVIMNGDLVNRGPSSLACLELFSQLQRDAGWLPVKGNHETWMLRCAAQAPRDAIQESLQRFAYWSCQQLGPTVGSLQAWPDHLVFAGTAEDSWVHVTHGTLESNRHGISASVPDAELVDAIPRDVALFVTAHTHRPLTREVHGIPVLNVGSVGSPFDGDPRGSYGLLELRPDGWHTRIERFDYDRTQAERDFVDSGFIDGGGPMARILFAEWRLATLLMPGWRRDFEPAVIAGERALDEAVDTYLSGIGV